MRALKIWCASALTNPVRTPISTVPLPPVPPSANFWRRTHRSASTSQAACAASPNCRPRSEPVPVSRALRRLFRVLHLEEAQRRRTLESALSELHRLERALAAASEHDRQGRELIASSAHNGDLIDRLAGLEQAR